MLIHGEIDGDEMTIYSTPRCAILILAGSPTGSRATTLQHDGRRRVHLVRAPTSTGWRTTGQSPRRRYPQLLLPPRPSSAIIESLDHQDAVLEESPQDLQAGSLLVSRTDGRTSPATAIEHGIVRFTRRIPTFVGEPLEEHRGLGQHHVHALRLERPDEHRLLCHSSTSCPTRAAAAEGYILTRGPLRRRACSNRSEKMSGPTSPCSYASPKHIEADKVYQSIKVTPTSTAEKDHRIRINIACGDFAPSTSAACSASRSASTPLSRGRARRRMRAASDADPP